MRYRAPRPSSLKTGSTTAYRGADLSVEIRVGDWTGVYCAKIKNACVTACLAFTASSKNRLMASSSTTNTRGNCRPTSAAQCSFKFKAPTKRTLFTVPSPIVTKSLAYWGHLAIEHVLGASVRAVDSCAVTCPCIYIRHWCSYSRKQQSV